VNDAEGRLIPLAQQDRRKTASSSMGSPHQSLAWIRTYLESQLDHQRKIRFSAAPACL
jgi:hypothetical protein